MPYIANQRDLLITGTTLTACTMLAVGARFWARYRLRSQYGVDDALALAAGFVFWVNNFAMWWAVSQGYQGIDPHTMTIPQLTISLKLIFAGVFLMSLTLTLCRLSVIFLYNRLFGVYEGFRKILIAYGIISVLWPISIWCAHIWRCSPISGAWDMTIKSKCAYDLQTLFVAMESLNAILDIFLVVLPITKIKILNMATIDKIGLAVVFLMGGFVGLTSVFRIAFTYHPRRKDASIDSTFWLWLQLATAIICACLPTLRSLLPKTELFSPITTSLRKMMGSDSAKSTNPTYSSPTSLGAYAPSVDIPDNLKLDKKPTYPAYSISTRSDDDIPLTGVPVDHRSMP